MTIATCRTHFVNRMPLGVILTSVALLCTITVPAASAQSFNVIYNFTSSSTGSFPVGTTLSRGGVLYGSGQGGPFEGSCCGGVFSVRRAGTGWVYSPVYAFPLTGNNGGSPGPVTIGPNGSLYAANGNGGNYGGICGQIGCGNVLNFRPPATACTTALCPWSVNVLYSFNNSGTDANMPSPSQNVSFDRNGNLYGTTLFGGPAGDGTVYMLTPSNGGWTETILYSFSGGADGGVPYGGVTLDAAGNVYGTTTAGGTTNNGTVFELSPSGSGWTEKVLYSFQNGSDGSQPSGDLVFDSSGNLYGTASIGGTAGGGTVFELTPSGDSWTFNLIYALAGVNGSFGPIAGPTFDAAGNLYGTTVGDGAFHEGSVFKLTRSGEGWIYSDLHDFTGGNDGEQAYGGVSIDSNGNIYGTAKYGGPNRCSDGASCGVVFEITQ